MQTSKEELFQTYRNLSDEEIASLHAQIGSLTNAAKAALQAETQRRGISIATLRHLNTAERQREAKFDKMQEQHERRVVSEIFRSPYFWYLVLSVISVIAAGFGLQLSRNH